MAVREACVRQRTVLACRCEHAGNRGIVVLHKLEIVMLETIAIVLLVLWALGLVTSYTMGGFIHVLLLFAVIVLVMRVIQGRRVV